MTSDEGRDRGDVYRNPLAHTLQVSLVFLFNGPPLCDATTTTFTLPLSFNQSNDEPTSVFPRPPPSSLYAVFSVSLLDASNPLKLLCTPTHRFNHLLHFPR